VTSDLIGQEIGPYRLQSRLGKGAMGTVYEAENTETRTLVALKVLQPQPDQDPQLAARMVREGKAMSMFRHPNIVELLDVGSLDDGTVYLATELVKGRSLRELLDDGPVEPARALAIVRQVLDALGHAHGLGVVHRDVKPENIMVSGEADTVKVLDFGVAKLLGDTATVLGEGKLTKTDFATFGTPLYIAPECVLGRPIDRRADLYSVGVVTYELLTGVPPFVEDDPVAVMRRHVNGAIPKLADRARDRQFTAEEELLVSEALAKKPEVRFTSAGEMISAVDAALRSLDPIRGTLVSSVVPAPNAPPWVKSPIKKELAESSPHVAQPAGASGPRKLWRAAVRQWHLLTRKQRRAFAVIAGGGAFVLICIVALTCGGGGKKKQSSTASAAKPVPTAAGSATEDGDLAQRANALVAQGSAAKAVELVELGLAGGASTEDATAWLALGHARVALGRRVDGLTAYERALELDKSLGKDDRLRSNLIKVVESRDTAAAILALDLLARRIDPPAKDVVLEQAKNNKLADVRHRAFTLAEREGFGDQLDRVESASLDLVQANTCEERRIAIAKLRATNDKRALPALKRARAQRCVEADAAQAIGYLEAQP
jgi:serine/threonine-protein kinase